MCLTPNDFTKFTDLLIRVFRQNLPSSDCYYTKPYSKCSEEDLRAWAKCLVRLQGLAWLLPHQSQIETSKRCSKCLAFWLHPQPIRGTRVELPWRFLMNPRLMIWHWLENKECSKWMSQWTDSVSPSKLASSLLTCLPRSRIASAFVLSFLYEVDQISFFGFSTLIAELFSSRIREWMIYFRTKIRHINENRSETIIFTSYEAEVCAWWNSKFWAYSLEYSLML